MKAPKKLNLKDLQVDSFVTSLESKNAETLKGGSHPAVAVAAVAVAASAAIVGAAVALNYVANEVDKALNKK